MSDTREIRYNVRISTDAKSATRDTRELANETERVAKAEKEVARAVEEGEKKRADARRKNKTSLSIAEKADQFQARAAEAKALHEELVRRGALQTGARPSAIGGALEAAGLGGIGRAAAGPLGVVGGLGYGAKLIGETIQANAQDNANLYLSPAQREERFVRNIPFVRHVAGFLGDTQRAIRGRPEQVARLEDFHQRQMLAIDRDAQLQSLDRGLRTEQSSAYTRAGILGGLSLERPAGYDRGSVTGQRLDEEERKLLPLRQQQQVIVKERIAAEAKTKMYEDRQGKLVEEQAKLIGEQNRIRNKRMEAGNRAATEVDRERLLREEAEAQKRIENNLEAQKENTGRIQGARGEENQARERERQGSYATKQAEYEVAQGKENRVVSQAERLAGLGMEGRFRGKAAFELAEQIGWENAPPEVIAAARSFAPETVQKKLQKAGEQFLPEAQQVAPEEYDQTSIKRAREATDKAREEALKSQEENIKAAAKDIAESFNGVLKMLSDQIKAEMVALRDKYEREQAQRNGQFNNR